jgi:outer membrane protease
VKRIFLLVLALNFSALSAVDFTFETGIALRNSVTKEYVYKGEKCISQLDWIDDVIPILSFAGQAEFFMESQAINVSIGIISKIR